MNSGERITIERPDDETIEIYVDGELVASATHDEHGWSGMDAVEKAVLAVSRALAEAPRATTADQFGDEFTPYLNEQLRDPDVRVAYEAEQRDDEVIQFGHPRWGL